MSGFESCSDIFLCRGSRMVPLQNFTYSRILRCTTGCRQRSQKTHICPPLPGRYYLSRSRHPPSPSPSCPPTFRRQPTTPRPSIAIAISAVRAAVYYHNRRCSTSPLTRPSQLPVTKATSEKEGKVIFRGF